MTFSTARRHGSRQLVVSFVTANAVLFTLPAFGPDQTGPASADSERQISYTDAAALLIQAGRLDEASQVLGLALQQKPNDNEAIFLRGLLAIARKNYSQAINDFRHILAAEPDRERVRLELARAFFLIGDYENADRNFRFARAGALPDDVKQNIDQYLAAIQRQRTTSYLLSLAIADDTNVNGATAVRQIYLYGLPFTLSDDARQKSGVGAAVDIAGEFAPLTSESWKALIGGSAQRVQYEENAFNDMTLSAYAGPEYFLARWRFDTFATGFRRWYGDAPYSRGYGGREAIGFALFPTLQLGLTLDAQNVRYRSITDQSGPVYAASGEIAYTLSPSRLLRLSGGFAAQDAKAQGLADETRWMAIDYYQDLPFGFSTNFEPALSRVNYEGPLAAFGITRADSTWAFRLDVLNRRLEFRGFTPRLSLIHVAETSNIALYRYARNQIQLGVTRQF